MSWSGGPYGGQGDPFAPLHFPDGGAGQGYPPQTQGGYGNPPYGMPPGSHAGGHPGPYPMGGPYGPPSTGGAQGYPQQQPPYSQTPFVPYGQQPHQGMWDNLRLSAPFQSLPIQYASLQYQPAPVPLATQSLYLPSPTSPLSPRTKTALQLSVQRQGQPQHPPYQQQPSSQYHQPPHPSHQHPPQQHMPPHLQQQTRPPEYQNRPPSGDRRQASLGQASRHSYRDSPGDARKTSSPPPRRDAPYQRASPQDSAARGPSRSMNLGGAHRGPAPSSPKFSGARPQQRPQNRVLGGDRSPSGSPSGQARERRAPSAAAPRQDEPPFEVTIDIDAEFEECKPTGKTGLSFYSSILVGVKTLVLAGKKLIEYWANRCTGIAKGDVTAKEGLQKYQHTFRVAFDKVIGDIKKGSESLKDNQVTFLHTSIQALQTFADVLIETTASASPSLSSRDRIADEMDGARQHLQNIIFSAKSLLVATELLAELKMQALREQSKPARPTQRATVIQSPSQKKSPRALDKAGEDAEREKKLRREREEKEKKEREQKVKERAEREKSEREKREQEDKQRKEKELQEKQKKEKLEKEKKEKEERERKEKEKAEAAKVAVKPESLKEPEPPKPTEKKVKAKPAEQEPSPRADDTPVELSGFLLKQGEKGLTKRWSQRWFQQKGRKIYYYKERPKPTNTSRTNTDILEIHSGWRHKKVDMDKEDVKAQGHFDIMEVQMVMPGAKVKGGFTFDVAVSSGRVYHLQATTVEDQMRWMSGILAWRGHFFDSDKKDDDSMGLPINSSMKRKEKVAALESYVQDLESTIKTETEALAKMEKGGATQADTEPKREMLRELQQKQHKAVQKLRELNKNKKPKAPQKPSAPAQSATAPAPAKADAKPSANPSQGAVDYSAKSSEQLEEELKKLKERSKKLIATKGGLEKLIGFYAKDPVAQQKAQQEVKQMQEDIDKLKKQVKDIEAVLDQRKSAASATAGAASGAASSQTTGYRARALYAFTAQSDAELSFLAGDIINLIDYSHDEWWTGELNGREGSFPCSYVETLDDDEHYEAPAAASEPASYESHQPIDTASTDALQAVSGEQAEVLYDFTPAEEGELECKQGDILDVLERPDDEWIKARLHGRVGVVPANYVQIIETFHAEPEATGHEYGEGESYTAVALYDFVGQSEEELSFKAGDVITLTDYTDEEWWWGTLNGAEGTFPSSYVQTQE